MQKLGVPALVRLLVACRAELASAEATLNSLNVFPVPDGDTGTNMRATLDAGLGAVDSAPDDPQAAYDHVMTALLKGAQGNSGVIIAEYIRGFSTVLRRTSERERAEIALDRTNIVEALAAADAAARQAVSEPVEGTVLTISRVAAEAATRERHARPDATMAELVTTACEAALAAVKTTPDQLQALAGAGVIDAGGAGLVLMLDCLHRVVTGRFGLPSSSTRSWLVHSPNSSLVSEGACTVEAGGPAFELMAVLETDDEGAADKLRAHLGTLGESVVVAGGAGVYRVHVHTDSVLEAASLVREAGTLSQPTVTRFDGPFAQLSDLALLVADPVLEAYGRAVGAQACPTRTGPVSRRDAKAKEAKAKESKDKEGRGRSPKKSSPGTAAETSALPAGEAVDSSVNAHMPQEEPSTSGPPAAELAVLFDGVAPTEGVDDATRAAFVPPFAVAHVVQALEERVLSAQWAQLDGADDEVEPDGSPGGAPGWSDADLGEGDESPSDVCPTVVRADSWLAAQDVLAGRFAAVERLIVVVAPDAPADRVERLLAEHAPSGADVVVLRLESGDLVQLVGE